MQGAASRSRLHATLVLALLLLLTAAPGASALNLFTTHEVRVQFATQDGKPMADAEVKVFAPGEPNKPYTTGRTDANGKFEFGADHDGLWSAEAHVPGEVARVTIRVGGGKEQTNGLSPALVLGGLAVLLVVAVWYRLLRARRRR
ncbi:MAG TPA: DUF4198 domain-containing protein [Stellaceae bacterium]|nr:DUF4198 domain-containing protein [Stellaceae bacterium]